MYTFKARNYPIPSILLNNYVCTTFYCAFQTLAYNVGVIKVKLYFKKNCLYAQYPALKMQSSRVNLFTTTRTLISLEVGLVTWNRVRVYTAPVGYAKVVWQTTTMRLSVTPVFFTVHTRFSISSYPTTQGLYASKLLPHSLFHSDSPVKRVSFAGLQTSRPWDVSTVGRGRGSLLIVAGEHRKRRMSGYIKNKNYLLNMRDQELRNLWKMRLCRTYNTAKNVVVTHFQFQLS